MLWYTRRTDLKANISHCSPGLYFSLAHNFTTSGPDSPTRVPTMSTLSRYLFRLEIKGVVGEGSDVSVVPVVVVDDDGIYTCKFYI